MAKNNTFKLNGKTVIAKPFDFNLMCDLDEMGISMDALQSKPNAFIRVYIAMCLGVSKEVAGEELQKHIIAGNSTEEIIAAMAKSMEDSDFFQTLTKRAEEKNQ